jgi:energy-coupling factor transport system substrate-specific component
MSSAVTSTGRARYRTIDLVTIATLGVAFGVMFWAWGKIYEPIGTALGLSYPPSFGLLVGPWLMAGLGVELILALFLYRRFGVVVAALGGALAGAFEAGYEWQSYYADWDWPYRFAHLGFMIASGAVIAGIGGWALVRALASAGVLDAFGPGRESAHEV